MHALAKKGMRKLCRGGYRVSDFITIHHPSPPSTPQQLSTPTTIIEVPSNSRCLQRHQVLSTQMRSHARLLGLQNIVVAPHHPRTQNRQPPRSTAGCRLNHQHHHLKFCHSHPPRHQRARKWFTGPRTSSTMKSLP